MRVSEWVVGLVKVTYSGCTFGESDRVVGGFDEND